MKSYQLFNSEKNLLYIIYVHKLLPFGYSEDFLKCCFGFFLTYFFLWILNPCQSPFLTHGVMIKTNLNLPYIKELMLQFATSIWFLRRMFLNLPTISSLFPNKLPFEWNLALYLNKFESCLPKHALCSIWLILAQWFCRKR